MTPENIASLFAPLSSPPLFIYTVTPRQVSTSTGTNDPVSLSISVLNPKANGFVAVKEIMFGISIGTGRTDLTEDPADVQPQSEQSDWIIEKQKYVSSPLIFKVTPALTSPPTTGLKGGESISFQLTGINVNDAEGGASFYIAEMVGGHTRQETMTVNKVSPSLSIEYFRADPSDITPGGQATLSWVASGATYCTIDGLENSICQGSPQPPEKLPTTSELQVCPAEMTIYTLRAYDAGGGHVEAQAGVSVTSVQILSFTANPTTIDIFNAPSTLAWEVLNAVSLRLDPGAIDVTGKTSYRVTPEVETTYTLTAHGAVGDVSQPTTIYVEPPVINSFTSAPVEFTRGEPVALSWATAHANPCSIEPGVGKAEPASGGHVIVSLQEQTTYTLTAKGLGAAATAQLSIAPPPQGWIKKPAPPVNSMIPSLVVFQDKLWCLDLGMEWVCSSVDGATWTIVTEQGPWEGSFIPSSVVVFNDKMWIMDSLSGDSAACWCSADGANWVAPGQGNSPFPRSRTGNVVFKDRLWVVGGNTPQNTMNDVWSSADGSNWTQVQPQAPWSPRMLVGLAVFNDELWMCGGVDEFTNSLAEAWHSADGVTWHPWGGGAPPWPARVSPGLQALNGKLYLISGADFQGAVAVNDMWVMDANLNWSKSPAGTPAAGWIGGGVAAFKWHLWLTPSYYQSIAPLKIWAYNT